MSFWLPRKICTQNTCLFKNNNCVEKTGIIRTVAKVHSFSFCIFSLELGVIVFSLDMVHDFIFFSKVAFHFKYIYIYFFAEKSSSYIIGKPFDQ